MIIPHSKRPNEKTDIDSKSDTSSIRTLVNVPPSRHASFFQPIVNVAFAGAFNALIACTFSVLDYLKTYDGSGTVTCFVATGLTVPFLAFTILRHGGRISPTPMQNRGCIKFVSPLFLIVLLGAWIIALRESVVRQEVEHWSTSHIGGQTFSQSHGQVMFKQVWVAFLCVNELVLLALFAVIKYRKRNAEVRLEWEAPPQMSIIGRARPLRRIRSMSNIEEVWGERAA